MAWSTRAVLALAELAMSIPDTMPELGGAR